MGAVYRARHIKVGRKFAIKVLHESLTNHPKLVMRFEREAELAGRLDHPNVVGVVDVGVTDDGMHYLVMEFAPGQSLATLVGEPMATERVLELARQLCDGLQHAHDMGLIHRDFKPDNVIVERDAIRGEHARIVDFGVAILRDDAGRDADADRRYTTKGVVVGTPHYMAPEQARGGEIDHRVDLFALGLVCYELLTGKLPFEGDGVEIARANLSTATPPMGVRVPTARVDPILEAIVAALLEKDSADRPPTARAARELFDLYDRDRAACALRLGLAVPQLRTSPERPPSPQIVEPMPPPAREPPRRTRRALAMVALVAALVIALVIALSRRGADVSAPEIVPPSIVVDESTVVVHEPAPPPLPLPTPSIPFHRVTATVAPTVAPEDALPVDVARQPPSAAEVATLYASVGRELKALDGSKGDQATYDLWPRYRWIRINEWLGTPATRSGATALLDRLRHDIKTRGRGSAED